MTRVSPASLVDDPGCKCCRDAADKGRRLGLVPGVRQLVRTCVIVTTHAKRSKCFGLFRGDRRRSGIWLIGNCPGIQIDDANNGICGVTGLVVADQAISLGGNAVRYMRASQFEHVGY